MRIKRLKFTSKEYVFRMLVIIFAAIAPYICIAAAGYQPSLSSYWKTDMQPLFIFANAMTSYFLFSMPSWKASAALLMALTAFSVDLYPIVHNILAVAFFLLTLKPLFNANRFKWILIPYFGSVAALPWSMLASEILAINALCIYHALVLRHVYHLGRNKKTKSIYQNKL